MHVCQHSSQSSISPLTCSPIRPWLFAMSNRYNWSLFHRVRPRNAIAKGSQKYLEANEVKYFSLGGGGGRRFHGHYFTFSKRIGFMLVFTYHHRMKPKVGRNFTSERGEGVKGEVKNISLHWLQCIFETVPKMYRVRHCSPSAAVWIWRDWPFARAKVC